MLIRTCIATGILVGIAGLGLAQQKPDFSGAKTVFSEARIGWDTNAADEKGAIAATIMNRWQIVNGYQELYTRTGTRITGQGWGTADGSLRSIVYAPGQFAVWSAPGVLSSSAQSRLTAALNSDSVSNACLSLLQSITVAGFWSDRTRHGLFVDAVYHLAFTGFASNPINRAWYENVIGSYGSANVFYGVSPFNRRSRLAAAIGDQLAAAIGLRKSHLGNR